MEGGTRVLDLLSAMTTWTGRIQRRRTGRQR
jgi:hypothetical protein